MCDHSQAIPIFYILQQESSSFWTLTVQIATVLTPIIAIIFSCIFLK